MNYSKKVLPQSRKFKSCLNTIVPQNKSTSLEKPICLDFLDTSGYINLSLYVEVREKYVLLKRAHEMIGHNCPYFNIKS
jgi:hypothetical protein